MRRLFHGDMNHGLRPYTLLISVLTAIEGYFAFGKIYLDPTWLSQQVNLYIEMAWLLALVVTTTFGWGVIFTSRETKCPKCGQKFMFTRKRRRIVGQGIHRGSEVTNYKSDWSCDNCR